MLDFFSVRRNVFVCFLMFTAGFPGSLSIADAQTVAESSLSGPSVKTVPQGGGRASSGQRTTIQSTSLESLLLDKGVITQDDWIHLKAEEERRVFEQTAEMQMAGNPRWYERIRISGYTQFRIAAGMTDSKFSIPLGDKAATSQAREFYFRRIRLVFQGQISERLAFFLQGAFEARYRKARYVQQGNHRCVCRLLSDERQGPSIAVRPAPGAELLRYLSLQYQSAGTRPA